jgi:prevent-host-death family protein
METIPHRELRNQSSAVLARVRRGESFEVTNHGDVVAVIVPPAATPLERARRAGSVREARRGGRFSAIQRIRLTASTAEILDDLRGDR